MTAPMARSRARRPHRAAVLTSSLLLAALVGAGCSGGGDGGDAGGDSVGGGGGGGGDRKAREVSLDLRVGQVVGALDKPRSRTVAKQVGAVVDRWFEAAYLGGDYPRASFADSWPGWTPDARRLARRDKALTSNAALGRRTESVVGRNKKVRVDVLAHGGKPRAATARFLLLFDRDAQRTSRHRVQGRLMLVADRKGRWRVVGYDLKRSQRALGGGR